MSLEQIEEGLVKSILSGTLALHILRSSRKPTSKLVRELLDIDVEVGRFVGQALQMHAEHIKVAIPNGALASALSFIPIPSGEPVEKIAKLPSGREYVPTSKAKSGPKLRKQNRKRTHA